jgi:putative sterol carrier protein
LHYSWSASRFGADEPSNSIHVVCCLILGPLLALQGQMNPQIAFMTGKLKLKGNMGMGMKLGKCVVYNIDEGASDQK